MEDYLILIGVIPGGDYLTLTINTIKAVFCSKHNLPTAMMGALSIDTPTAHIFIDKNNCSFGKDF